MQAVIEKTQQERQGAAPVVAHIEVLNELQLALVGGGNVTVIIG